MDVAQALANLLSKPPLGRTLALPGPSTLTHEYLLELIASVTYNPTSKAPSLPKPVALALAKASNLVWWPTVVPDEVERRFIDDADTPGDWDVVDIVPDEIEAYAIKYLRRFRSAYVVLHCVLRNRYSSCIFFSENYVRPVIFPRDRPFVVS